MFSFLWYRKTTMDEIAAESGFGKATLYYYFTSKDEVFIAIMEDGWRQLWEGIESKIVQEVTRKKFMGIIKKWQVLLKVIRFYMDFCLQRQIIFKMNQSSHGKPIKRDYIQF